MSRYWIWLESRKGLSRRKKLELVARFPNARTLWEAEEISGLPAAARASFAEKDLAFAERILADCDAKGIRVLTAGEEDYPRRLRNIDDPPLVLYYKGALPPIDRLAAVGVVGTRRASAYGLMAAEQISRQITELGGLVVSGMAAGIDAQAAWGALHAGGATVAVLGCGVDVIYPAENRELYHQILEHGCILSEYPPGTPPGRWTFPKRNRIVSGLSCAVLAVEAPEKSGTMITARLALEQGRDLFVVPGHIHAASCAGSNALLRDGGRVATCGRDILEQYAGQFPMQEAGAPQPKPQPTKEITGATADEMRILQQLLQGERTVDELIAASGLEPQKAMAVLTMLELKGMVTTLPGSRVIIS